MDGLKKTLLNQFTEKLGCLVPEKNIDEMLKLLIDNISIMVLDLVQSGRKKIDIDFDLMASFADLFESIVEEKFKSLGYGDTHKYMDFYEKQAIRIYFDQTYLESLDVKCDDVENKEMGLLDYNSIGEYCAARYLAKHSERIYNFQDVFFNKKYIKIRFFFDEILAKNCKVHLAILHKSWQLLETYEDVDFRQEDERGRDPLQLMCSWGTQYEGMNAKRKTKYGYILNPYYGISDILKVKKENTEYIKNLQWLATKCDPTKKDRMFYLNAFEYASKSRCFLSGGVITCTSKIISKQIKANKISTLFYCVINDYSSIFDVFQNIFYVKNSFHGHVFMKIFYFEHLLALLNLTNCFKKVLSIESIAQKLDFNIEENHDWKTPIHYACRLGHSEIVELLLKQKISVEVSDRWGVKPIHCACQFNNAKIVRLLVEKGANVNVADENSCVPIAYARLIGNIDIVNFLIENGAREIPVGCCKISDFLSEESAYEKDT